MPEHPTTRQTQMNQTVGNDEVARLTRTERAKSSPFTSLCLTGRTIRGLQ